MTEWNKTSRKYKQYLLQESLDKLLTEDWWAIVLDQGENTEWE